jgi:hypothetical protein
MSREKLIWVFGDQVFHFSFEHNTSQSFTAGGPHRTCNPSVLPKKVKLCPSHRGLIAMNEAPAAAFKK